MSRGSTASVRSDTASTISVMRLRRSAWRRRCSAGRPRPSSDVVARGDRPTDRHRPRRRLRRCRARRAGLPVVAHDRSECRPALASGRAPTARGGPRRSLVRPRVATERRPPPVDVHRRRRACDRGSGPRAESLQRFEGDVGDRDWSGVVPAGRAVLARAADPSTTKCGGVRRALINRCRDVLWNARARDAGASLRRWRPSGGRLAFTCCCSSIA